MLISRSDAEQRVIATLTSRRTRCRNLGGRLTLTKTASAEGQRAPDGGLTCQAWMPGHSGPGALATICGYPREGERPEPRSAGVPDEWPLEKAADVY